MSSRARWASGLKAIPVLIAVGVIAAGLAIGFGHEQLPPGPSEVTVRKSTEPLMVSGSWPAPDPTTRPESYVVADAIVPVVDVFESPGVVRAERPSLDNPTHEGLPVVFRVLETDGDWLHVAVSERPNESTAWVRRDQVEIREVPYSILIEVGTRKLTVLSADTPIFETSVAVGTDSTPTPLGTYFVDGWVPLDPGGPYGAGQLSVAGFSEVLHSFGSGIGQIAIHGTNRPGLIGQAVSNGCVRVADEDVLALSLYAPLGTPVEIVA